MPDLSEARTTVVLDWLTVPAGAVRVAEAILEGRPGIPLHALFYDAKSFRDSRIGRHPVQTSFLQRVPGIRRFYRATLPLMCLAVEGLDMRPYDLVISLSHAIAKGVLTSADQLHISYVFTPVRYAWDLQHGYLDDTRWGAARLGSLAHPILHYLRLWDLASSRRPDVMIASSHYIARRIRKVYGRVAPVIHPPVDVERFVPRTDRDEYYVTVSRLVSYKKVELIAEAFTRLGRPLVIIGDGPERRRIARHAGPNVKMLGWQPDAVVTAHLERCKAFVFAADEDFGIVPVEAMAAGAPVIAYGKGGVLETVVPGETGVFFERQAVDSLMAAVVEFEALARRFHPEMMRQAALPFARKEFQRRFETLVAREWRKFQHRRRPRTERSERSLPVGC
jgi:glycosyltransferase involved in cell wall biosynthesis